jgi:two-component system phosphate regulon response regulator PhoB
MEVPQPHTDPWSSSRRRILVVDDDPSLRLLLRETLAADEFELEETASAEEARDVARFWRPSVVLLDVTLPGLDGLSFCKQLTGGGALTEPAVILLTGTQMSEAEARDAGARAFLAKPFSPLELIALIDSLDAMPNDLLVGRNGGDSEQLLMYARDLNRVVEIERAQRRLLQQAYRQTVAALATSARSESLIRCSTSRGL